MSLAAHISRFERALREAETLTLGSDEAQRRLRPRITRATLDTPAYLRLDVSSGVELLPAGPGGPRARTRSLGRISLTLVAGE